MSDEYSTWGGVLDNQDVSTQIENMARHALSKINTIKLCRIIDISDGEKKYYTVQNLVSRVSAAAAAIKADIFYEIQDCFISGGNGGFIIERKIGDIVAVGFFDRESTQPLKSGRSATIKSFESCPRTSGVILGAVYYTTPATHITINNHITMVGDITHDGDLSQVGNQNITGSISAGDAISSGVSVDAPAGTFDTLTVPADGFASGGMSGIFTDHNGTPHIIVNGLWTS